VTRVRSNAFRRAGAAIIVGALLFAVGFVGLGPGGRSGAPVAGAAASRLGFYPGYAGLTSLRSLEGWLGQPASYVVQFGDIREAAFTSSIWGEVAKAGALQSIASRVTLAESIPLAFGSIIDANTSDGRATARGNLQATVNGSHDAEYRVAATYLRNGGYPDAIIRLGWEFDGEWMPWSARGNEALWITAYRHVADIFRSVSSSFRFDWNGTAGFLQSATNAYPGDNYVDIVGLDVYDKGLPTAWNPATNSWTNPAAAFAFLQADLQAQRDFATAHGKTLSYPEWALTGVDSRVTSNVGGDDPTFIQGMGTWMKSLPASGAGSLSYQSYFNEDTEDGHHRINANYFPYSAARYKFLFGSDAQTASVSLSAEANLVHGEPVVLTSNASAPNVAPADVSGKVTFVDGFSLLGEGVINNGVATFTAKSLSAGMHWIWAFYQQSDNAELVVSPIKVRMVAPGSS
jgi:hypothetical protein